LNLNSPSNGRCPFAARIQPRAEGITVTGSFSIIASMLNSRVGAASASVVRRAPSTVVSAYSLRQRLEIGLEALLLPCRIIEQRLQLSLFGQQRVALLAQFHFLQLAQRAQPHVEDRLGLPVGQLELAPS